MSRTTHYEPADQGIVPSWSASWWPLCARPQHKGSTGSILEGSMTGTAATMANPPAKAVYDLSGINRSLSDNVVALGIN